MRLISQSGAPEPVNVPYDGVTIKLQKVIVDVVDGENKYVYTITADDGNRRHTLGWYSTRERAESVFSDIINAGAYSPKTDSDYAVKKIEIFILPDS